MSWRTAWTLGRSAYFELAFQSIYGLRRGNPLPVESATRVLTRVKRRVIQSKAIISLVLAGVTLASVSTLAAPVHDVLAPTLPDGLYVAGVLSVTLALQFSFLWWTGLQLLPSFLTSGVMPLLETLPVDRVTLDRLAVILLFRMFDVPAATAIVLTPVAVGFALQSGFAGLALVPGVLAVIVFAMLLALETGRFFVRRVQGAGGGAARTLVRWTYLVLWAIPALALYAFLAFGGQFFSALESLAVNGPAWALSTLTVVFPVALAALPATIPGTVPAGSFPPGFSEAWVVLWATVWGVAAFGAAAWLSSRTGRLVRETAFVPAARPTAARRLLVRVAPLAVLWKDLRTASRTPGYAFLVLLPVLDALAIGALTFVGAPGPERVFNLGVAAVTTAALLATFFGPAFFAVETMGFSYTRTLPITQRSMLSGKVFLVSLIYLVAAGLILILTATRVFSPGLFGLFILAELPAVVAAACLQLLLLFRKAWTSGVPIVNLYSAAWYAAIVTIPGVLLAFIPLATFFFARGAGDFTAIGWLALVSVAEFSALMPFVARLDRRGAT